MNIENELNETELLRELSLCAIFSSILQSTEFNKLKYKGQLFHRYKNFTILQDLDKFKNFNYLVNTLQEVKQGKYQLVVPRKITENLEIIGLLEGKNYVEKDNSISLEEMVWLLLSDIEYTVAEQVLVDFFNKNYYTTQQYTNRLTHSQQVMLVSGLIAKKLGANLEDRLTSIITGLFHDIGHLPMAHTLEKFLQMIDDSFSHEENSKDTVKIIYERKKINMKEQIQEYCQNSSSEKIEKELNSIAEEIGKRCVKP